MPELFSSLDPFWTLQDRFSTSNSSAFLTSVLQSNNRGNLTIQMSTLTFQKAFICHSVPMFSIKKKKKRERETGIYNDTGDFAGCQGDFFRMKDHLIKWQIVHFWPQHPIRTKKMILSPAPSTHRHLNTQRPRMLFMKVTRCTQ